jgi:hypothetical protein
MPNEVVTTESPLSAIRIVKSEFLKTEQKKIVLLKMLFSC